MALQGTLDTFALADLVRLLATTGKTGELAIDGDRGAGRLWFADGQLVGGEPSADEPVDAVFALLRMEEGDFAFHTDLGPDEAREPQSALDALAAAEARLEEWRPVEELVPSPGVALALCEELPADEVTIDRDLWLRLRAVGGGTTARAFGAALGLDEIAAGFAVRDLVEAGLVQVGDEVEEVDEAVAAGADEAVADVAYLAGVDPLPEPAAEVVPEDGDEAAPGEVAEGRPALGVVPEPPYSFGQWGEGPMPAPETQADPTALGPWEPLGPPAGTRPEADLAGELPSLDEQAPVEDLGSYAVDLDSQLGGATPDHSYLGTAAEGDPGLPEPLLGTHGIPDPDPDTAALSAPPEPAPSSLPEPGTGAAEEVATDAGRADEEDGSADTEPDAPADLGVPLDSLSPAAARALTAAASADGDADTDAGRRVLRRIISTGKG